jgi:hypothetical protein
MPATIAVMPAAAAMIHGRIRDRRDARWTTAAALVGGNAAARPCSASAKSLALANRSAGSFSSAHITASFTCAGTCRRVAESGRGSSVISRAKIACAVWPVCGGSPASIS